MNFLKQKYIPHLEKKKIIHRMKCSAILKSQLYSTNIMNSTIHFQCQTKTFCVLVNLALDIACETLFNIMEQIKIIFIFNNNFNMLHILLIAHYG